jgi:O-antigen/teichoic acid export membrane protein
MSDRAVVRGSSSLLVSIAVMAIGGFVFNAIAARTVPREVLGVHASLLFWVLLLNQLTSLGLPVTISRLGRSPDRVAADRLMTGAFALTVASSVVGTALFWWLGTPTLRTVVHDALFAHGAVVGVGIVAMLVAGLSLTLLVEIRLVALGLGRWVVIRSVVANIARVGLLAVEPLREDPLGLLAVNLGINAMLGTLGAVILVRQRQRPSPDMPLHMVGATAEMRIALVNWIGIAAIQAPQFAVPVLARLDAESNAAFYLAWQIMTVAFLVPIAIGHVVVIDGTRRPAEQADRPVRTGLLFAVLVAGIATISSLLLSGPVTTLLFGDSYDTTADLLPRLVAAGIPWSVTAILLARTRITGNSVVNLSIAGGFAVSAVVTAIIVGEGNPFATSNGWLVANAVAAGVAVAITVVAARSDSTATTPR